MSSSNTELYLTDTSTAFTGMNQNVINAVGYAELYQLDTATFQRRFSLM
jgi:hypothetical protein